MTYDEFVLLAKGLKCAYTNANFLPDANALKIWYSMLQDIEYEHASAAVQRYICTEKFPPTIADIRNECAKVAVTDRKDWLEGWSMITRCIGRYGYTHPQEALAALRAFDEPTARVAEMLGWQNLCVSENPTADRANFRRAYESIQQRQAEELRLPQKVHSMLSGVSEKLRLTASEVEP